MYNYLISKLCTLQVKLSSKAQLLDEIIVINESAMWGFVLKKILSFRQMNDHILKFLVNVQINDDQSIGVIGLLIIDGGKVK